MIKNKNNLIILMGFIIGIIISATGLYAFTKYESGDIYYDNSNSSLMSVDVQGAVDELAEKYNSVRPTKCLDGYVCFDKHTIALGDYVSMTPTKSSYTTDKSKTGYTESQTINPQELNLWRVISINDDGTVDMISEYVSSTEVYFSGQTGYQNLVGYLNVLASQYENNTYTKGSRYFGYDGQTEYITDTSKFTTTAPWTCSTGGSCNSVESQGGGDELYTKDFNLVYDVFGDIMAPVINGSEHIYWIASRFYNYYFSSSSWGWAVRFVTEADSTDNYIVFNYSGTSPINDNTSASLRPIVTLKSGLKYFGSGTKDDPVNLIA